MSLPDPVRLRLLADGDYELSTSLYHAAQFLVTSLYRHPTYRDLLPVVMDGIGCMFLSYFSFSKLQHCANMSLHRVL